MKEVTAVEVTRAVRDSSASGLDINEGDVIALVDDVITTVGAQEADVVERALRGLPATPELVTIYRGGETSEGDAMSLQQQLAGSFPDVEFEVHDGGQSHYSYILSIE